MDRYYKPIYCGLFPLILPKDLHMMGKKAWCNSRNSFVQKDGTSNNLTRIGMIMKASAVWLRKKRPRNRGQLKTFDYTVQDRASFLLYHNFDSIPDSISQRRSVREMVLIFNVAARLAPNPLSPCPARRCSDGNLRVIRTSWTETR